MRTKHGFAYAIAVAQLRDALPYSCAHYARADADIDELYALIPKDYKRELQVIVAKGGPNLVSRWNTRWAEIYLAEVGRCEVARHGEGDDDH